MSDLSVTGPLADPPDRRESGGPAVHCSCGRFAKYRGTHHYYNGTYDCATMYVECSRCGHVTIELV